MKCQRVEGALSLSPSSSPVRSHLGLHKKRDRHQHPPCLLDSAFSPDNSNQLSGLSDTIHQLKIHSFANVLFLWNPLKKKQILTKTHWFESHTTRHTGFHLIIILNIKWDGRNIIKREKRKRENLYDFTYCHCKVAPVHSLHISHLRLKS